MDKAQIEQVVKPIVESLGFELVDIEIKKRDTVTLTIFIHNLETGLTNIEDCEKVSNALNAPLESLDPFAGSWDLSVSSPGLDRAFTTDADFLRNIGKLCEIKLYHPLKQTKKKLFEAKLLEYNPATKVITVEIEGKAEKLSTNQIAKISQAIIWN